MSPIEAELLVLPANSLRAGSGGGLSEGILESNPLCDLLFSIIFLLPNSEDTVKLFTLSLASLIFLKLILSVATFPVLFRFGKGGKRSCFAKL